MGGSGTEGSKNAVCPTRGADGPDAVGVEVGGGGGAVGVGGGGVGCSELAV